MISKELTRRVDVVWTIFKMEYSEIYGEQFSERHRQRRTVTVTASGKIFGIYQTIRVNMRPLAEESSGEAHTWQCLRS